MPMLVNFRDGSAYTDLDICHQVGLPEDGATVAQVQQANGPLEPLSRVTFLLHA
jgi:hypothetical protein